MPCGQCSSGWRIVTRNGKEGAERCPCSVPKARPAEDETPASAEDFVTAVSSLASIPFFPADTPRQALIVHELRKFITKRGDLKWLCEMARSVMRDWEKEGGVPQLRGLFCEYGRKPADGIMLPCTLPGHTWADIETRSEAAYLERSAKENEKRFLEYRKQALLGTPEDSKPFELPPAKPIAAPTPTGNLRPSPKDLKAARDFDDKLNPKHKLGSDELSPNPKPSTRELEQQLAEAPRRRRTPEENEVLVRQIQQQLGRVG